MISAIHRSHLIVSIFFRHRQKLKEEKLKNQMPGIRQKVCSPCQCGVCGRLFPSKDTGTVRVNETPVDDDNGSEDDGNRDVDDGDEDAGSEMVSNEN